MIFSVCEFDCIMKRSIYEVDLKVVLRGCREKEVKKGDKIIW